MSIRNKLNLKQYQVLVKVLFGLYQKFQWHSESTNWEVAERNAEAKSDTLEALNELLGRDGSSVAMKPFDDDFVQEILIPIFYDAKTKDKIRIKQYLEDCYGH